MTLAALVLLAAIHTPEECVTRRSEITATHAGKIYAFRYADCREEFLTDPERYAQLYDALLEMEQQGLAVERSAPRSLVPS